MAAAVCTGGWACLLEAHLAHLLSLFLKEVYMEMSFGAAAGDSLTRLVFMEPHFLLVVSLS
jgi:hypothetical protein